MTILTKSDQIILRAKKMERITSLDDARVQVFSRLTEAQLKTYRDTINGAAPKMNNAAPNLSQDTDGLFIAESPKVIRVALDAGYEPVSLLCEEKHITGDAADIIQRLPEDVPVYTGDRQLLAQLTGYTLTRGVLCAMRRPQLPTIEDVCKDARRIVVIHGVCDTTNIGAIFRSAAALGIDAVMLTPDSCDPLNRRAVRVSMGTVFLVPWTWLPASAEPDMQQKSLNTKHSTLNPLRRFGFKTVAMALTDASIPLDDPVLKAEPRLALIMGTEGDGLPYSTIAEADYTVRIPMQHGVDSLNVAAAAAVAFWELR